MADENGAANDLLTEGVTFDQPTSQGVTDPAPTHQGADNQKPQGPDASASAPASVEELLRDNPWMAQLPADLKNQETLTKMAKFKNGFGDLGKAYLEPEGKLGETIAVPGEKATAEDWNRFYSRMGRPETADGYKLEVPKDLNVKIPDELVKELKQAAFTEGLSQKQAQQMFGWYSTLLDKQQKVIETARVEARKLTEKALRDEWGAEYPAKINAMKNAVVRYGSPEFVKFIRESSLGNHPEFIRIFAKIGETIGEDRIPGHTNPTGGMKSPIYGRTGI